VDAALTFQDLKAKRSHQAVLGGFYDLKFGDAFGERGRVKMHGFPQFHQKTNVLEGGSANPEFHAHPGKLRPSRPARGW